MRIKTTQTVMVRVSEDFDKLLKEISERMSKLQDRRVTKIEASHYLVRFYRNNHTSKQEKEDWVMWIDF